MRSLHSIKFNVMKYAIFFFSLFHSIAANHEKKKTQKYAANDATT